MDMNPLLPGAGEGNVCKDAMFFSVHKFVGGVQTPGETKFKFDPNSINESNLNFQEY